METSLLYHRLVWQPADRMHVDWWDFMGLAAWRPCYPTMPEAAKRALNIEIQRRRQQQGVTAGVLNGINPLQKTLLRTLDRLPQLLLALGLFLSQSPDYLLWRPYRQALATMLTEDQLTQLWGMWRGGQRSPDAAPDEVVAFAQQLGLSTLHRSLSADPVWQVVRYTLPYHQTDETPMKGEAVALFLRLERFL
mgnify:CR=1 FL=1